MRYRGAALGTNPVLYTAALAADNFSSWPAETDLPIQREQNEKYVLYVHCLWGVDRY
jgi:hypothetical protein